MLRHLIILKLQGKRTFDFCLKIGPPVIQAARCSLANLSAAGRLVLSVAFLTTIAAHALIAQRTAAVNAMLLRPGDLVRVSVWRKPELSGDFLLAADSTLKHPLYQDVKIGGLTVAAAREVLVTFLKKLENSPQVSIEPLFRVAVAGEVIHPNLYSLSPETTIAEAVATAGGPTQFGLPERVRLFRDGKESFIDMTEPSGIAITTAIASGDQIYLIRRGSFLRDIGIPLMGALGSVAAIVNLALHH